jgi:hypothetical protein
MAEGTRPIQTGTPKKGPAIALRAWVRIRNEEDIRCRHVESIYTWSGSIQEATSAGITLNLRRRFEPGMALSVELAPKDNGPRGLVVRVIRATRQMDGGWLIACALASPLTEAELETLLGE